MDGVTRNTAYKVWIADLISGNYFKGTEQFDAGYVEIKGKKVSRVNLICGIVDKFSGENYISASLDDGSGIIQLKVWGENINLLLNVNIGDLILVIGKLKQYNNFIYVTPEVVRKLDAPLWLKLRKLELVKEYGEPKRIDELSGAAASVSVNDEEIMNVVEEKVTAEVNSREVVLGLIEALDSGNGADFEDVVRSSKLEDEARDVINELLKEGEVFELHTGKLRITG